MTRIEIGITHEVTINGDKSWIRLSIADDYELSSASKTTDINDLTDALAVIVNAKLIDVIEQTVKTVEEYQ